MGIRSFWKHRVGLLIGLILFGALLPVFAAQAQIGSVLVLVRGRGATLYDQPGGNALRALLPGDRLDATGRTADAAWIIGAAGDGAVGWLRAEDVIIFDLLTLPVVEGAVSPGGTLATIAPAAPSVGSGATPVSTSISTPTATATPSPTPTQPPTATPSPTPTFTPTPLTAPSGGQRVTGVVRGSGAALRTAPGGAILESAGLGAGLTVTGRSADGAWLLATSVSGVTGWVARNQVVVFGVESLPLLPLPVDAELSVDAEVVVAQPASSAAAGTGHDVNRLVGRVATGSSRLNVRSGPGATFAIVAKEIDGAPLSIQARSEDGEWLQVSLADGDFGWVAARFVTVEGRVEMLPVSDAVSAAPALAAPATSAPVTSMLTPSTPISQFPSRPISSPASLTGKLALSNADGAIILYDLAGGTARRLTGGFDPAISPDGQRVAFVRGGEGLFVIDVDGGNERLLYGGGVEMRAPAWSPDGQFIVFSRVTGQESCRNLGFGICLTDNPQLAQYPLVRKDLRTLSRVGLDGADFQDIPTLNTATAPSWTAGSIVYQSNSGLQITQDGPERDKEGELVNRALTTEYLHRDPVWRPDGGRIAFMDAAANHHEIYVINPDGAGLAPLTRPASTLLESLPHNVAPAWSLDGRHIAFLSNRDGEWAVFVMNEDGSNQRRLDIGVELEYRFQNEQVISWGR